MTDSSSSQPPGWYYAQGDPVGTQRYWDGSQWVGGPQAVAGAVAPGGGYGAQPMGAVGNPAEIGTRIIAFLIDWGIGVGILIVGLILSAILGAISDALGAIVALLSYVALLGYIIWNSVVRQGQTGQTVGKQKQNIKLISLESGQPVGTGGAILRLVVSYAISFFTCSIGAILDLLWPLWDQNRQRLTDKILKNNVVSA